MTPPDDDNGPITLTIDQLRARARAAAAAGQQEVEAVYLRTVEQREKRAALAAMETPEDKAWLERRRQDAEVEARVAAIAEEMRAKIEAEENARALAAREADQAWLDSLTPDERQAVREFRVAKARAELEANDPVARTRRDKAALMASVKI
jgi:hypothetical protein